MIEFKKSGQGIVSLRKLNVLVPATQRQLRHALFDIGASYKRTANHEILHGKKSGRVYILRTRSGRKRKHRASAPGQSHANLTGKLRRSMGWKVSGSTRLIFGYGVTQDAPVYAHNIEVTKKRPSLANAIKSERRNTMNSIDRAARRVFEQ